MDSPSNQRVCLEGPSKSAQQASVTWTGRFARETWRLTCARSPPRATSRLHQHVARYTAARAAAARVHKNPTSPAGAHDHHHHRSSDRPRPWTTTARRRCRRSSSTSSPPSPTGGHSAAAAAIPNPIARHPLYHPSPTFFISPTDVVLRDILFDASPASAAGERRRRHVAAYHRAGPRREVAFDSATVRAAIVTCGGLCPGTNTVVRELVVGLSELYGVRGGVFGVRNGYRGFYSEEAVPLDPAAVEHWHKSGGAALGTSRGGFDLARIVDAIERHGFNQVYAVGGDGTMRGAARIHGEVRRRGRLAVAVAGIPKTVDNDVGVIDRSFGFHTEVEAAQQAIAAGHVEAESAANGVGLVKLMGRSAGHIALHATLSSRDVDCCLIPEEDFYLRGAGGLFDFLYRRIKDNGHAVVVVAEGAGQRLIPRTAGDEAFLDVGAWLKAELRAWRSTPARYMIRAVPANAGDNLYCTLLAHAAIHGAMAGYTGFVSGTINGNYAYIPMDEVAEAKNPVDTKDHKWAWVRSITNQPDFIRAGPTS
uniref:Phosphofructokinase domain-containing protein n=1 Tax=Oryza meridionalis TaxID=40149 RepID=A0A0E0ET91_9ORYZ